MSDPVFYVVTLDRGMIPDRDATDADLAMVEADAVQRGDYEAMAAISMQRIQRSYQ